MGVPLASALLYAAAPAAVGVALAFVLLAMARGDVPRDAPPDARGRVMILFAVPLVALVLAALGAFLASAPEAPDTRTQLIVLGFACFAQAAGQGFIGSRSLRRVAAEPAALGRALLPLAAVEVLSIGALVWLFVSLQPGVA